MKERTCQDWLTNTMANGLQDQYICPQNHKLPLKSRRKSEEKFVYRADAKSVTIVQLRMNAGVAKVAVTYFALFIKNTLTK